MIIINEIIILRPVQFVHQRDHIKVNHHYYLDILNATMNFQFKELNNVFSEGATKLLTLNQLWI